MPFSHDNFFGKVFQSAILLSTALFALLLLFGERCNFMSDFTDLIISFVIEHCRALVVTRNGPHLVCNKTSALYRYIYYSESTSGVHFMGVIYLKMQLLKKLLKDAYSGKEVTVVNGKVTLNTVGTIILLEKKND